jgi:hypothetical protein
MNVFIRLLLLGQATHRRTCGDPQLNHYTMHGVSCVVQPRAATIDTPRRRTYDTGNIGEESMKERIIRIFDEHSRLQREFR